MATRQKTEGKPKKQSRLGRFVNKVKSGIRRIFRRRR